MGSQRCLKYDYKGVPFVVNREWKNESGSCDDNQVSKGYERFCWRTLAIDYD